MGFIFAHFVCKGSFRQIWAKNTERSIKLENFLFGACLQVMVFQFVHFEYKKNFWHILIKFLVYKEFLLSNRSHKKLFQLVDVLIGRL